MVNGIWIDYRANLACEIALKATSTVFLEENGRREIDIKRYAKVEKVFFHVTDCRKIQHLHVNSNCNVLKKKKISGSVLVQKLTPFVFFCSFLIVLVLFRFLEAQWKNPKYWQE